MTVVAGPFTPFPIRQLQDRWKLSQRTPFMLVGRGNWGFLARIDQVRLFTPRFWKKSLSQTALLEMYGI